MSRNSKKHVHKYHKVNIQYTEVWACALSDCTHFMPQYLNSTIPGKNSICWECGNTFPLDSAALEMTQPKCPTCRMGIKPKDEDELDIDSIINKVASEIK